MKRLFSLFVLTLIPCLCFAESADANSNKVSVKFGGRIDVRMFSDSYNLVDSRNGVQYFFPAPPSYNAKGQDINSFNRLRTSIATSRLSAGINVPELLGAKGLGFAEVDFLGPNESTLGAPRIRHAYFSLQWEKTRLVAGQTYHLNSIQEMAPNTVDYPNANPFFPIVRPVQVMFHANIHRSIKLSAAAAFFNGETGRAQGYAFTPDFHLQMTVGNPSGGFFGGFTGGYKSLKPRTHTEDKSIAKARIESFDASVFGKLSFGRGYNIKLYGLWGEDLSPYSMIGGYAPLLSDIGVQDYGYANVSGYAAILDFETRSYYGWKVGIFGGITQYLGSSKDINLDQNEKISYFGLKDSWRVAPRVWYTYNKLSFGLEYIYSHARWGDGFSDDYSSAESYSRTHNNRVSLLARFTF